MPNDIACPSPSTSRSGVPVASVLQPVESAAAIWSVARREFHVGKVERMPLRARMLDVLEHLQRGHLLALMGSTVPAVWLDGRADIALLAGVLFCCGYVEIAGRHRDNANIVYFALSPLGARKLREGRVWWNSLTPLQRLWVRLFG